MALIQAHYPGGSEWQRVRSIRLRALREDPNAFGSTFERESQFEGVKWVERLSNGGAQTIIASSEGQDIGLVTGAPYNEFAGLFSMWVAPQMRGQRVGERLVEEVIMWARSKGYERVLLDVANENFAAIRLYEKMDFVPTGVKGALPPPRQGILEHQRALSL